MSLYEKPVLFAVAAVAVISVGTLATTFVPLFMPATQPVSRLIKPYTAVETEGRDIYVREGCNNCHTQTVRPLRSEVARYGEYSKPEEFAYDRPFLWGSRRTGPDLARIGTKYPDSWHYQHMGDPQGMFPKSNMPRYRWLAERTLDTSAAARKASVLGFGYSAADVARHFDDYRARVTAPGYASAQARSAVTPASLRGALTEMDAMVAYLQKVGSDVKAAQKADAAAADAPAGKNPFAGSREAEEEGEKIFKANCESCHGEKAKGGFGPALTGKSWKHGGSDAELFATVSRGRPGGMPPFEGTLGADRIWKVIAYIRSLARR
ncbi:MAG: cytochrome-c oxidase, cbb3-type subunit II [Deltaproteobacteria bacterium]